MDDVVFHLHHKVASLPEDVKAGGHTVEYPVRQQVLEHHSTFCPCIGKPTYRGREDNLTNWFELSHAEVIYTGQTGDFLGTNLLPVSTQGCEPHPHMLLLLGAVKADRDCDGPNPNTYPGALEYPSNGQDDDCDDHEATVVQVAGGYRHTLALDDVGRVWAWGWNQYL